MEASSSTKGFFQTKPVIPPQFPEDKALQRIISLHLPSPTPKSISDDLLRFSRLVLSKQILGYIADAERNTPYVKSHTSFGVENKEDPLVTSEGWRELQNTGIREGIVALAYEGSKDQWNHRIHQYVKYHLWSGSSAIVTCPSAMTDGAAKLLGRHLNDENREIFAKARSKLISREKGVAWTSGQWMTERKGGSDVRGTETVATKVIGKDETDGLDADGEPLGPWKINGFKWFSSATDANMTVLLAKTGKDGEISAFYAPLRRRVNGSANGETELNGIRIQRMKNKLGTKPLPTAELELKGMRGYLIGKEGQGVKEISTVLNITRMQNIVSSVGAWGRGLAISRAFARVRSSGGRLLCDIPAHVRGLAQEHVKYWAHMHLSYFIAALLGRSEGFPPSNDSSAASSLMLPQNIEDINALYRILTPIAKAQTALASINGLRACMESLGGVGYLENEDPELNVARIFRDTNVLAIWEGTTDIMADDLVRAIKGRGGDTALSCLKAWIENALVVGDKTGFQDETSRLRFAAEQVLSDLATKDKEELKWKGKDYLRDLDFLVCSCLLILDASRDGNDVVREITLRWIHTGNSTQHWREQSVWDKIIVFGEATQSKL
ncbi:acyl-CoA dehydrogenase/oxidase [Talaromyces proteolyticus]|uniref:Acyl-CoA dehydrogenase/oxidase n=1 Tax=Talaromyces proteolyticus TaxID=1131652 RepID=A0AAD4KKH4_9EURO|nr:acyl-CoA dehydrogenase/oxidase [Talaromyces proteolyticus]KAH8693777.1 acyl-CoA dehydrogenase/oxidase [Talaromyces proteolyticus]